MTERRKQYLINRFYDHMGGKHMAFAWMCFMLGVFLALKGKLTYEVIGFIGAMQGFVTIRAIAADKTSTQTKDTPPPKVPGQS